MSRPVTDVRPLAIGAAWLEKDFECLAPRDWDSAMVRAALFERYEFRDAGWKQAKTGVVEMGWEFPFTPEGVTEPPRRWKVSRT